MLSLVCVKSLTAIVRNDRALGNGKSDNRKKKKKNKKNNNKNKNNNNNNVHSVLRSVSGSKMCLADNDSLLQYKRHITDVLRVVRIYVDG